jgi:hypothetical protein
MTTGPQVTKEDIQSRLDPFGSTLTEFKQPLHENKIKFICVCGEPAEKFMDHVQRFVGLCAPCAKKLGREKKIQTEHSNMREKVQVKLEEDGATLKEFPSAPLKHQKITYYCNCGNEGSKSWEIMKESGAFCDACTLANGLDKKKETVNTRYGVDHIAQSTEIRDRTVITNTERYGGPTPMSDPRIVQKVQDTLEDRTGFRHPLQNPVSMERFNETLNKNYGVTGSSMKNPDVKARSIETVENLYGFDNVSKVPEFHQKKQDTSMQKYGVPWPMQNEVIFNKSLNNSFLKKEFKCPSGRIITCQGYEPAALSFLLAGGLDENLISDDKPKISWNSLDGNNHVYTTDIFIPCLKLCIEIKSMWTFENDLDVNMLKQKATRNAGYNHVIWIFSPKGELIDTVF